MNIYRIDHEDETFDVVTECKNTGGESTIVSKYFNFIILASSSIRLRGNEYCANATKNEKKALIVYALYNRYDTYKIKKHKIDRYELPILLSCLVYRSCLFDKVMAGQD